MHIPGAHIVTLHNPVQYAATQIDKAAAIAHSPAARPVRAVRAAEADAMSLGEVVVWLPEPFALGTGTVMGHNEIGWIEVVWQNGELGIYCPNALERADVWERAQVEAAFGQAA